MCSQLVRRSGAWRRPSEVTPNAASGATRPGQGWGLCNGKGEAVSTLTATGEDVIMDHPPWDTLSWAGSTVLEPWTAPKLSIRSDSV